MTAVAAKIPQLDPSRHQTQANTYVYAANGHTVLTILRGSQARIIVPSKQISPWLKHSIVAIEDKRFYEHRGVDLRGMARALWADISHRGTVQGGSTITQQFVKNAYLTSRQTVGRKLIEAALAWQLEQKWTKDQILTAYLNTVYFGNGAYGVQQAAKIYFQHSAATMKPAEAALLAGIPEDPSLWDPVAHPRLALARRNLVLRQLYAQGYLTQSQFVNSLVYPMPDPSKVGLPSTEGNAAPYFANYVKDQLVNELGPQKAFGGGLKVTTSLDVNLQKIARDAIASVLPQNGVNPAVALVAIDTEHDPGAVLAMVGGANYHKNQFNLATQGERQPGSAFKPFVLATALRENISPSSTLTSSKQVAINAGGRLWVVNNYEGEALGPIDLTKAIAVSDNSVFSQLTALVGPQRVADTAKDLGILTPLQGYFAIGLGAEPATPLDMARAYTAFADGGRRIDGSIFKNQPRAVESITAGGNTETNAPVPKQVLTPTQAATIDQLLQGVVQGGTGTAAALPGREVAGKTGTTENYGDAWFVGYTPQLVAAVWVGYPDKLIPMTYQFHGHAVAGGTFPALIWKAFMTKALAYMKAPPENFAAPPFLSASPDHGRQPKRRARARQRRCARTPTRWSSTATKGRRAPPTARRTRWRSRTWSARASRRPGRDWTGSRSPRRSSTSLRGPATGSDMSSDSSHAAARRRPTTRSPSSWRSHCTAWSRASSGSGSPRAERKLSRLHLKVRTKGPLSGRVVHQSLPAQTASAPGRTIVLTLEQKTAG